MAEATPLLDRCPPYSQEAEQAAIGSLILYPDAADDVAAVLDACDFYDDAHVRLYGAVQALHAGGHKIDPVLLVEHLKAAGDFEVCGGQAYLWKVTESVPNGAHAVYYARIVAEHARRRALIAACTDALRDAYEASVPVDDLVASTETAVMAIRDSKRQNAVRHIGDVLTEALALLDARMAGKDSGALPLGFHGLDDVLGGGLRNGNLCILAARTRVGKSAFAGNVKTNVARAGRGVYFASLEMTAQELADRTLSGAGRVDSNRMRSAIINAAERKSIADASGELSQLPIWYGDESRQRVGDIAAGARRAARRCKVPFGLIIVDYLQLIDPEETGKASRQEQVARIGRRLKTLARERNVPVLALCQLNREAADESRPRLHHLRESGALEQDADVVLLMWRENDQGLTNMEVAKQRNGPEEIVKFVFDGKTTTFRPAASTKRQSEGDTYSARDDEHQEPTQSRFAEFDAYNATSTDPDYTEFPR
jgi:replicative DNA helicase